MIAQETKSQAESLALLPEPDRKKIINSFTDAELEALLYDWNFWARENQLEPKGDWLVWLLLAGRGFGKTRSISEQTIKWVNQGYKRLALVAQTPAEARDVLVEGESGILACSPPWNKPVYETSKRRLTWPNGAIATIYSGMNPAQLRGPQHEKAIVDELAKYRYPEETWSNLEFGMRLGDKPQIVVATTPQPINLIKELLKRTDVVITKGTTYDNYANLPQSYINGIIQKYEGTRLGRQELHAELLDDNPNALWTRGIIEAHRVRETPALYRTVVGVDPAVSSKEDSAETGIITVAAAQTPNGDHFYVIDDTTTKASPNEWAKQVISTYNRHSADRVIGERNNGGDMIRTIIHSIDPRISYKGVWATKNKYTRAEPIAALYEQGRVHHVGYFKDLEDELTEWEPGKDSPNRLDAVVWAITELQSKKKAKAGFNLL